jgi:hypothetical protein
MNPKDCDEEFVKVVWRYAIDFYLITNGLDSHFLSTGFAISDPGTGQGDERSLSRRFRRQQIFMPSAHLLPRSCTHTRCGVV